MPEPSLEVEFHLEKHENADFCLRQRAEAFRLPKAPLKDILQGSQRLEKLFFDLKNVKNLFNSAEIT